MKCLSLWDPWGTLCVLGKKRFETRHWSTPHRGPLLIHVAKRWTSEQRSLLEVDPFASALADRIRKLTPGGFVHNAFPLGCIAGVVNLVNIHTTSDDGEIYRVNAGGWAPVGEPERSFGNYAFGRYAWAFSEPRAFPSPIPFKGHQTIFNVPDELVAGQLAACGFTEASA